MTDHRRDEAEAEDEGFTSSERQALDAWTAVDPPRHFVDRVLDRADKLESPSRTVRARWATVGLGGAGIAAAGLIAVWSMRPLSGSSGQAASGHHQALARTTLHLGARAVVVSEPETDLEWTIDRDGVADVKQSSGNAFYRVEPGGKFVVHTPEGEVHVVGTCFRVEVESMKATHAGFVGTAAGAALAATVLVTVYEGKVVTASPQGRLAVEAGETARLAESRPPEPIPRAGLGPKAAVLGRGLQDRVEESRSTIVPESMSPAQLLSAHRALAKEAEALRGEVAALRSKLEQSDSKAREVKTYDLSHDELAQMADNCELRWDMQPLRGTGPEQLSSDAVQKLHLSDDEKQIIERLMKADHQRLVKDLAALYTEITGDASTGSVAPMSMFEEINDKAPKGEISRVFQKLARERAGVEPPPADLKGGSPWERAYRLMTTAGDKLESSIAAELGPDVAHALRDLHQGFGSKSRSQVGCPKGEQP